jgi:hypothetical protein
VVLVVVAVGAGCATTSRTCPTDTHLVDRELPGGRVEACAAETSSAAVLPVTGRTYAAASPAIRATDALPTTLASDAEPVALPAPGVLRGGLEGPFTRWYPGGAIAAHGSYVLDGDVSVPDGVWGFWYADGKQAAVGRYDHGRPVGCFAVWDDHGTGTTGVVGDHGLDLQVCAPPADPGLAVARARSRSRRATWGDLAVDGVAQLGRFGASNPTQVTADPAAEAMVELEVRKRVGAWRVGGALAFRFSDTENVQAYAASAVAAYALPIDLPRIGIEVEARLGVQDVEVTPRTPTYGAGMDVGFVAPLGGLRLIGALALGRTVSLVVGAGVDGAPTYTATAMVVYAPPATAAMKETWTLGGADFGLSAGVRLTLR